MINSEIYALRLSKIGEQLTIIPVKEMGSQYALDFASCPLPESVCKQKISEQFSLAFADGDYQAKGITRDRYMDLGIAHILKSPFFGDANKVLLEGDRVVFVYKTNSVFTLEQLLKELHASEIRKAIEAGNVVDWNAIEEDHPGSFNQHQASSDPMQSFNGDFEDMLYGKEEQARNNLFSSDPGILSKLQSSRDRSSDQNLSPLDFYDSGAETPSTGRSLIDENAAAEARFAQIERKTQHSFSDYLASDSATTATPAIMDVDRLVKKESGNNYAESVSFFNENLSAPTPNQTPEGSSAAVFGSTNTDQYFESSNDVQHSVEKDVHTQPFNFESEITGNESAQEVKHAEPADTFGAPEFAFGGPASESQVDTKEDFDFAGSNSQVSTPESKSNSPFEFASDEVREGSTEGPLQDEANESVYSSTPSSFEFPAAGSSEFQFGNGETPSNAAVNSSETSESEVVASHSDTFDFNNQAVDSNVTQWREDISALQVPSEQILNDKLKDVGQMQGLGGGFDFDNEPTAEPESKEAQQNSLADNGWVDNESFGGSGDPAPWESTLTAFSKKAGESEGRSN